MSTAAVPSTQIKDLKVGTGIPAGTGDIVVVHYTTSLPDGPTIDDSRKHGFGVPIRFPLGHGKVIRGWDRGIVGMQRGGIRRLTIPPEDAYGDRRFGPYPANATLIFEIELVQVIHGER